MNDQKVISLFTPPRVVASTPSPAERVIRSHKLVEQAAHECGDGRPGSGVRSLLFAAGTHLALTIGPDEARKFLEMVARVAADIRPEPTGPGEAA